MARAKVKAKKPSRPPREFGGLGGIMGGRGRNRGDLFEAAIDRAFGKKLRREGGGPSWSGTGTKEPMMGQRIYGSITNMDWRHGNGDTASYSFRAAGDLIASLVGEGDYMDWYCSWYEGQVDDIVAKGMAKQGWSPVEEAA